MIKRQKLQIGVMGSCADLRYSKELEEIAAQIGFFIAQNDAVLFFGAEKDLDSLSTAAARGAKEAGGMVVGVTYNKSKDIVADNVDVLIVSGLERGGGRELSLVLSCDAIITIGGGSGTLTEMAIAYQAGIPIVAMKGSGGWSDTLKGTFLDDRKRLRIEIADNPEDAVKLALKLVK